MRKIENERDWEWERKTENQRERKFNDCENVNCGSDNHNNLRRFGSEADDLDSRQKVQSDFRSAATPQQNPASLLQLVLFQ